MSILLATLGGVILALAIIGAIALYRLIKLYYELKAQHLDEGVMSDVDEDRFCKAGHKWSEIKLYSVAYNDPEVLSLLKRIENDDSEAFTELQRKANKSSNVCLECGYISGRDQMLGVEALIGVQNSVREIKILEEKKKLTEEQYALMLDETIKYVQEEYAVPNPLVIEDILNLGAALKSKVDERVKREQSRKAYDDFINYVEEQKKKGA